MCQWIVREQAIVGQRVEELGAGLFLAKGEVTLENLRVSVQRLIMENSFREQATRVCESFQSAGGTRHAVEAIRAFTR